MTRFVLNGDLLRQSPVQAAYALLERKEIRAIPPGLNEIIGNVLRLLPSDFTARGKTVRTALADGLPDVRGAMQSV